MKIGIFGGCFNPPHNKHKMIALDLINNKYLDKVIYVPTGNMYLKKGLIDINDRINMLNIIFKNYINIEISDLANNINYQYTYQVLDYFQNLYPNDEIYFICGTDNLKQFDTWRNYKYILEKYKLLILKRNNDNVEEILAKYEGYNNKFIIVLNEINPLSSTLIRELIKKGESLLLNDYLDKEVIKYIKEKNLYKN